MQHAPNAINHLSITSFLASRGFQETPLTDQEINTLMIAPKKDLHIYKSPFDRQQCCRLYVYSKTNMFKDDTLGITGFLSDLLPHYYCCSIEDILTDPERFDIPQVP